MHFRQLKTGYSVCFGAIEQAFVWLVYVTDKDKSEIAYFTSQNPQFQIENWLLVPNNSLIWTEEHLKKARYPSLAELAYELDYNKPKLKSTRSERLKRVILSRTWRRPANKHKLIWRFRVKNIPEIGDVLSIVWATECALEAFRKRQPKQLELFTR